MLVSSPTVLSFSSSLRQLKERRSSIVSSFAHSFTISGLISLILSFMPYELWVFYLFQRLSFLLFLLRTFKFSVTSFRLTSNDRIFSPHFYRQDSMLPLRKSLRPLTYPLIDSSITILPLLLYTYPRYSCNSLLRSLRFTRGLLLGEKEESLGVCEAMLCMLGGTLCPFWGTGIEKLFFISLRTLSQISLKISTSFLACSLSAFSFNISIFYILWQAILSSLSIWLFLSFNFSVSLTILSASTLFYFLFISSLMRFCSRASSQTWDVIRLSSFYFCFIFYQN